MAFDHKAAAEKMALAFSRNDFSIVDALYATDSVHEHPQSGEVIRGSKNLRAVFEHIPDLPSDSVDMSTLRSEAGQEEKVLAPLFTVVRVQGRGEAATIVLRSRYPDGSFWWVIVIYEVRDGLISHTTSFFGPEFEPAAWRAPFVEPTTGKPE